MKEDEAKNSAVPSGLATKDSEVKAAPSFTAGPWEVVDRRKAPLPNVIIVGADGSTVASAGGVHMRDPMLRSQRPDDRGRWTPEHADAADARALRNARLIAAAPDLYEALSYVDFAAEGVDPDDDGAVQIVVTGRGLKDIRAALASADGKPNGTT